MVIQLHLAQNTTCMEDVVELIYNDVKFSLKISQAGGEADATIPVGTHGIFHVTALDSGGKGQLAVSAKVRVLSDKGFLIQVGGRSHTAYAQTQPSGLRLTLDGQTYLFSKEYDPTRLTTDVAGKLVKQLVPDGEHIEAKQAFAEIEVMKMFMPVLSGEAGVLRWVLTEGAAMAGGDLMAMVELDHPELVKTATRFEGNLTDCEVLAAPASNGAGAPSSPNAVKKSLALGAAPPAAARSDSMQLYPHRNFQAAYAKLETIMKGYSVPDSEYEAALEEMGKALQDPLLPVYEVADALSPLTGRIDAGLHKDLTETNEAYLKSYADATAKSGLFASVVLGKLQATVDELQPSESAAFKLQCASLFAAAERFAGGAAVRSMAVLQGLVALYMKCEREFNYADKPKPYNEVVKDLRKHVFPGKPELVFETCRSHASLKSKNELMCFVLQQIRSASAALVDQAESASPSSPGGLKRSQNSLTSLMKMASGEKVDGTSLIKADLNELSGWTSKAYAKVALEARMLLIEQDQPTIKGRRAQVSEWLGGFVAVSKGIENVENGPRARKMSDFLTLNIPLHDTLPEFLGSGDEATQFAALELYIRRIYPLHNLKALVGSTVKSGLITVKFQFFNDALLLGGDSQAAGGNGMRTASSMSSLASFGDSEKLTRVTSAFHEPGAAASFSASPGASPSRTGVFLKCKTFDEFSGALKSVLEQFPAQPPGVRSDNCLHVALLGSGPVAGSEDAFAATTSSFLGECAEKLKSVGLSRVTFLCFVDNGAAIPSIFTFRDGARITNFSEDALFRNIEPSYAYHLDILRLRNFDIQLCGSYRSQAGNVHVYQGNPTLAAAAEAKMGAAEAKAKHQRFFVRSVSIQQTDNVAAEVGRMFVEALKALNTAVSEYEEGSSSSAQGVMKSNHIFLNVVANNAAAPVEAVSAELEGLMKRYRRQVSTLGVAHVEVRSVSLGADAGNPLRLIASDPTGTGIIVVEPYEEMGQSSGGAGGCGGRLLRSLPGPASAIPGPWDGTSATSAYSVYRKFEKERTAALASSDTLYCYDFLDLFREAVKRSWASSEGVGGGASAMPASVMDFVELVIKPKGSELPMKRGGGAQWDLAMAEKGLCEMVECQRPMGQNDVGMVAWLVTLRTPEYPTGRQIVLISNDITFVQGSFGTREDWVFKTASEYARAHGIPRLYLAANSGARIGMANTLKAHFKVEWNDPRDPTKGYKYLYLDEEDNARFVADGSVKTKHVVTDNGAGSRHVITDVIGDALTEPDLGVENLRGSGMIAGETSKAYDEIFTLTVVTGRSVGIGAYLVRLGHRTIQKTDNAPIILTGFQALNKLMGKDIYTSNDQLGGGGLIMYPNGVSHQLADDHLDAVEKSVKWLSFVPRTRGAPLPITDIKAIDSVERLVEFTPQKGAAAPYDDPRYLLDGVGAGDTTAPLGFFDKGSFTETLGEWAQTVVVGRARLGGIPMGVIVTENRTRTSLTPADPADPNSSEVEVMQAGGVWFPDSAYKTAQAIKDFKGEDLPVMIFANWRGFSGGQRDMFLEVLKFGAMIVDALVASTQPIFVYIPPYAELRGGAWVVVDSTINPDVMEFFAAEDSRGGVLEATGAASIKYRMKDIEVTMRRTDKELVQLAATLADAKANGDEEGAAAAVKAMKAREKKVLPIYQQIAVQFADLHDTPGRMAAAGVIEAQVDWKTSRSFFYWRLRRRLAEFELRKQICKADVEQTPLKASATLKQWFVASGEAAADWPDSRKVLAWIGSKQTFLRAKLEALKVSGVAAKAADLALLSPEGLAAGVVSAFQQMDAMQREVLRQHLAAIH
mmetsp:Transcript_27637/g.55649  ORF Transcript_27637/g.55649 Transcript_27637/m.55649 type:complete len:1816 (-) Transcript_27637:165-5612(-)